QDLFFRLQVVVIKLPSLAQRPEDILPLTKHFFEKFINVRRVSGITAEAQALLTSYKWPGNVRELENTIMSALVLGTGDFIRPEDLPEALTERKAVQAGTYRDQVNAAKRSIIVTSLRATAFDFYESARQLDIHHTYLYRLADNLDVGSD